MATDAGRTAALSLEEIFAREPAITSAEVLLEFAKRTARGRHLRVTRADAKSFLEPSGRAQVYKRVPVEWAGRISKPTGTDVRFDLDIWDGRTQAPETQDIKWVMLLQDRFFGCSLLKRRVFSLSGVQRVLQKATESQLS